ncbi:MAG: hypothetical protein V3U98_11970 [Acidobacteriota bacterium]
MSARTNEASRGGSEAAGLRQRNRRLAAALASLVAGLVLGSILFVVMGG